MLRESLYIYMSISGVELKFPIGETPAIINEWTYNAPRMGGTPTITGTVMHPLCLDDLWSKSEYVKLNGEKFYINQVPTSSKGTEDVRYKHEISLVSERVKLENIYFFDVVTENTDSQYKDRYRSNSTEFSFYGDLSEFVARINDSLVYSGLFDDGFKVVIDSGISTEAKDLYISNVYMAEALQEIYKTYDVPYYWVGKVCHVGYSENAIPTIFEYGQGKGLISIIKTNSNFRIINRITGTGSSENIPHYYPNKSEKRDDPENNGVWITPTGKLMPPIYRESNGADRFYNALNNTYDSPGGGKYSFSNPYMANNPMEGIQAFEKIKPTINGITNSDGQLFGEIADIAFDSDDSDDVDDNGEYTHSYFYVKLHLFNGTYGFNLFKQALAQGAMTFNMTSGNCAPCAFEVGVSDPKLVDGHYEFENPVQVTDSGNIVEGSYSDKVNSGNIQPRQQDTSQYEVWVALKKENTTFGVVMPNATNNYKPSVGDTFVITNISLPYVYITKAENDLKDAIIQYMSENNDEKFSFSITFSRIYLARNPETASLLNENARIIVRYNGNDYTLYVTNYSCKSDGNILTEVTVDLDEKLSVSTNSLKAQMESIAQKYAGNYDSNDTLARFQNFFIRKDTNDTAKGIIKFLKGIKLGGTSDGFGFDGEGNGIVNSLVTGLLRSTDFDEAGERGFSLSRIDTGKFRLFVSSLVVWGKAVFHELEVRKLSYAGGDYIFSPAGSVVQHVAEVYDDGNGGYTIYKPSDDAQVSGWKCWLLSDDKTTATSNMWKPDDQARCQTFNVTEGTNNNSANRYYWRLVLDASQIGDVINDEKGNVLYDGMKFVWIILSASDHDPMSEDSPQPGDTIVQMGNRTDTDRQNLIKIATEGDEAPYIAGYKAVHTYSLDEYTVFKIGVKEVLFSSEIFKWVSYDGGKYSVQNYRGEWESADTYYYYDTVDHNGEVWLCITADPSGTKEEPGKGSITWRRIVTKGEDSYSVEISTGQGGNVIINGEGTRVLTAHVFKGGAEITEDTAPNRFSWKRTSQDSDDDIIWNKLHEGYGNVLTVSSEDVYRNALFTCVVSIDD